MISKFAELYAPFADVAKSALPADASAVDPNEKPPPHPYKVWAKQLLPIAGGLATGVAAGAGGGFLYNKLRGGTAPVPLATLAVLSGLTGAGVGVASSLLSGRRKEELDRAKQEYENFYARRAGSLPNPTVQPPAVRS